MYVEEEREATSMYIFKNSELMGIAYPAFSIQISASCDKILRRCRIPSPQGFVECIVALLVTGTYQKH